MNISGIKYWLSAVCLTSMLGCSGSGEAVFRINEPTSKLMDLGKSAVETALLEDFGTPHKLVAWQKMPVNYGEAEAVVEGLEGTVTKEAGWNLKHGRNLYMKHCLHCHGVSGDGAGPTAQYLNPRPRDYRNGVFKFTSTISGVKASREDLVRTLNEGIPGTSMPSFRLLKKHELDAIVEYVRWLAMRGEYERLLTAELANDYSMDAFRDRTSSGEKREAVITELKEIVQGSKEGEVPFKGTRIEVADRLAEMWNAAEEESNLVIPAVARTPTSHESIDRGRALYASAKAKCTDCHGLGGKGDGPQTITYQPKPGGAQKYETRGLFDDWMNELKPRNLTLGQYRGGRRPVDLYRRIYAGIKGTPMPGASSSLKPEEIWDIVNYVLDVPYQRQTPETKVLQAEAH